ncbi:MAG: thiol protease/hemagglutinin PrtT [Bacteroidales bacterium]|nr:thiol protease/hemagglutinin PrtT [Bacteroidales bacterium]
MRKAIHSTLKAAILVAALFAIIPSHAREIDVKTAQRVGAYFMAAQTGVKGISPTEMQLVYQLNNPERNVAALYVFDVPQGGFVIVAGADCVSPVIAYSTEQRHFRTDNIPPAMLNMMNEHVQAIAYSQNNDLTPDAAVEEQWNQLIEQRLPYIGTPKRVIRLNNVQWSQNYPYNAMCPTIEGERCVVGCVATALSQILYHWKYPTVGGGTRAITYTVDGVGTISEDLRRSHYRYDLMSDDMSEGATQEAIDAVSLLCYNAGVAVRMKYGVSGSGSTTDTYIENALINTFKMDANTVKLIRRSSAPFANSGVRPRAGDTLWVDTIVNEIRNGRPVFYAGNDPNSSGGDARHAFVVDGYNSLNGYLRFNWGWGYNDVFCNLYTSNLTASSYTFTSEHRAVIGIKPPDDSIGRMATPVVENPFTTPAYPNPTSSVINISYNTPAPALLSIVDVTGHEVHSTRVEGAGVYSFHVGHLPKGIYIYRLNGATRKFTVR